MLRLIRLKTLDRYLLRRFAQAYVITFFSLVGLYIVIDAFNHFDEFTEVSVTTAQLLKHVIVYYACRVAVFFDRLAGIISMMAAMFVLGWMKRQNELIPCLAAGVPTLRVCASVLIASALVNVLVVANQEWLIPSIGDRLLWSPDDPEGTKVLNAEGAYDRNGILVTGKTVHRKDRLLADVTVVLPRTVAGRLVTLRAKEAVYEPPSVEGQLGRWVLRHVQPGDLSVDHPALEPGPQPGTYILHSDLTLEDAYRGERWLELAPTWELLKRLEDGKTTHRTEIAVLVHTRLMRPILNMTLIFLGLPMVLGPEHRKLFWNLGLCLVLSATLHAVLYICQSLGHNEILSPTLAAWLPILIFGPVAAALYDLVQT
jgi:lipopolysaccharide export system permease protein